MVQKDFKIGLGVGAVCLLGLLAWLATNKSLSTDARLAKSFEQSQTQPPSDVIQTSNETTLPVNEPNPVVQNDDTSPAIVAQAQPPISTPAPTPAPPTFAGKEPNLNAPEDPATNNLGPKIKTNRFHIVTKGETLSEISQAEYGTAKLWPKILEANRDKLDAPEKIKPGMFLTIPTE